MPLAFTLGTRRAFVALAVVSLAGSTLVSAVVPAAGATPAGNVTEFAIPTPGSQPLGMTTGPDGNLWFTETVKAKVGKMSTSGKVLAQYDIPGAHPHPLGIATGADGNLWFADAGESRIGRMTVNGVFKGFTVPSSEPTGIAAGPDGNIWFADFTDNVIGRMSMAGTLLNKFPVTGPSAEVVAGPDGHMWFTEGSANKIGKLSVSGHLVEYSLPTPGSIPAGIIAGVDGNMWFTENGSNKIAKMTTSGGLTEYAIPTPGSQPTRIVAGSDGNMWFTESAGNKVTRVTPGGSMTEYAIPTAGSKPGGTTPGSDGNIWFTELNGNKVARVTVGPPTPAVSKVTTSGAHVSAKVYPGGAKATSVIQCATNSSFTTGLVQDQKPTGSPSSRTVGVTVSGACRGLRDNTTYFARIKSYYSEPAGGPARTNTLYTTTSQFRTKAKLTQVPMRNCVLVPPAVGPYSIRLNTLTRLTKPYCRTNAGQPVVVHGRSVLRGDIALPRIFWRNGSWWIQTYGTPTVTRIVWSAPAVGTYAPYVKVVTRNT